MEAGPPVDGGGRDAMEDEAFDELAALAVAAPEAERAPATGASWSQRSPALMAFARQSKEAQSLRRRLDDAERQLADLKTRSVV